jgi:hypothetical protein
MKRLPIAPGRWPNKRRPNVSLLSEAGTAHFPAPRALYQRDLPFPQDQFCSSSSTCLGARHRGAMNFGSQSPTFWFRMSPVRSSAPTYSRPKLTLLPARSTTGKPCCRWNRVGRCSSSALAGFGNGCRYGIRPHQNALRNCIGQPARETTTDGEGTGIFAQPQRRGARPLARQNCHNQARAGQHSYAKICTCQSRHHPP